MFDNESSGGEEVEQVESPQKQLFRKRKKKTLTGFMRPTNSPMRIRARSTKNRTLMNQSQSKTSLHLKSNITPPEGRWKDQADL